MGLIKLSRLFQRLLSRKWALFIIYFPLNLMAQSDPCTNVNIKSVQTEGSRPLKYKNPNAAFEKCGLSYQQQIRSFNFLLLYRN